LLEPAWLWANPPTGGATWTSYSLDTLRGVLYASTGNAAPDFVEQLHPGENLYTTAVVALDALNGHLLASRGARHAERGKREA
jgi:glucose dehydrogenase